MDPFSFLTSWEVSGGRNSLVLRPPCHVCFPCPPLPSPWRPGPPFSRVESQPPHCPFPARILASPGCPSYRHPHPTYGLLPSLHTHISFQSKIICLHFLCGLILLSLLTQPHLFSNFTILLSELLPRLQMAQLPNSVSVCQL